SFTHTAATELYTLSLHDALPIFVQGFNFVIPAQAVKDFLAGTEVKLGEPSRFNRAWQAGLSDFFAGNHSRAGSALAEANRLMPEDRKSTRLNSSHVSISYAVFCL